MRTLKLALTSFFIVYSLNFATEAAFAGSGSIRTVALSGTPVPGTTDGTTFSDFTAPVLNNAGQTAFYGFLAGQNVSDSNNLAVWSEGGEPGLTQVARTGEQAPGTNAGIVFSEFELIQLFDNQFISTFEIVSLDGFGNSAFRGRLAGSNIDSSNDYGIWSEGGRDALELVARVGNSAPGTGPGVNFHRLWGGPRMNSAGHTAILALLTGAEVTENNHNGIWSEGRGNGLELVARAGNQVPGMATGVTFANFVINPDISDTGLTAFRANLAGPGIDESNKLGIWSEKLDGGFRLIARTGDHAPGPFQGTPRIFTGFRATFFNNIGQVAFYGDVTGKDVTDTSNSGIWSDGKGNGLELIALEGRQAPGVSEEAKFSNFTSILINDAGLTAFAGSTKNSTGFTRNGIWIEEVGGRNSGLKLVAYESQQAPGLDNEAYFSDIEHGPIVLNNRGQLAFLANYRGSQGFSSFGSGIWAQDHSGQLKLIVKSGDVLDVDDGPGTDLRTISNLSIPEFTAAGAARSHNFNDLGQLAYKATFTDGTSGIFISNLVAVPEPSTFLMTVIGLLAWNCQRRFLSTDEI